MYPRNAASPPRIAIGPVVQISDGAVQTSGVSVKVKPEGGTASAGSGTISYEEGIVAYVPTQGETDYTAFQVIAYKTGCIPAAVTVVTSASATPGKVVLSGETHTSAVIPTVSTLTNAPSDSSGTTTLLSRLSSTRAGYLDNLSGGAVALASGVNVTQWGGVAVASATVPANITQISGDAAAADSLEAALDGTGGVTITAAITGNITGNLSGSVGSVTGNVGGNVTGSVGSIAGVTFPTHFASLSINASGHIERVVLCDTITTYTGNTPQTGDAFARIGATGSGLTSLAQASLWTSTRAGYVDNLSGGAVALQATLLTVAGYIDTEMADVKAVTDHLATAIELDGSVYRFTANALELAPSSSGGDATAANQTTIISHLTAIKGAGFGGSTDSLEAISDAVAGLAVSSGSGAYTITITVNDGTTALQGAIVRVTEGVTTITGTTNASGVVVFALDAASWSLAITKPGYSYTPTTLTVSGTASFTRSMTAVTPASPAAPTLSTGTIICYGTDGLPESGAKVYVVLVSGPGDAGAALDGAETTLTANGSGVATHTGFVRGAVYKARRGTSGTWQRFTVPDAASFDIAELIGSP